MKIGMFSDSYLPYASGVVQSVQSFAAGLQKRGDTVYIIAPAYPGHNDGDGQVIRFPSYRFSRRSDFRLALPHDRRLTDRILGLGLDIVHSHSPFLLGGLARRLAKRLDVPLIFTYHTLYGEYVHYARWLPPALSRSWVNRRVWRYCQGSDAIVVPTVAVQEMLRQTGVQRPVKVVATGVDLREFGRPVGRPRAKFGLPESAKVLLFVGRLGREKNLPALLAAFRDVLSGRPDAYLLLVGDGPEQGPLRALAATMGIDRQVVFAGKRGRADVVQAYYAADLFVFSSLTETQGLVLYEALAAGLPVVAMKALGVGHVVRDGMDGILTRPDSGELAKAILFLLEHPALCDTMATHAWRRRSELSSTAKAQQLRRVYEALIQAG